MEAISAWSRGNGHQKKTPWVHARQIAFLLARRKGVERAASMPGLVL